MTLIFDALELAPVPSNQVHFTIQVEREACLITGRPIPPKLCAALNRLELSGLSTTIPELYFSAACLYQRSGQPVGTEDLKMAASCFQTWTFRREVDPFNQQPRLIATPPANDTLQTLGTTLLGVAVGLEVACKLYSLDRVSWDITRCNKTFDYIAIDPSTGGTIEVEVRARMNRNNWAEAVAQSEEKLRKKNPRTFANASAVLFAPRSAMPKGPTRTKDILIMDPSGDETTQARGSISQWRNILRHYAPIFERMSGRNETNFIRRFAARLRELSESNDEILQHYLAAGDAQLQYDQRGLEKPWRSFFRFNGQRFCGTAFEGDRWPVEIAGEAPQSTGGMFYFGLWQQIIEALRDGRLNEIAEMKVTSGQISFKGKVFVLLSDGVALAWAPNQDALDPGLFDDLVLEPVNPPNGTDQ